MSEKELNVLKEKLKAIFKGYRKLTASMEKRLNELGFGIVRSKNHIILNYYIGEHELRFAIQKTPGDFRSGIKTVKDITNVFRRSGLIY